jgi:hypothetical protein
MITRRRVKQTTSLERHPIDEGKRLWAEASCFDLAPARCYDPQPAEPIKART